MNSTVIILIVVFVLLMLWIIGIYNGIIRKKNGVENAFGGIDAQLKKRYDLIPNLVNTVKQYMSHEKDLLERITALRTKAQTPELSNGEKVTLDNEIANAMGQIMVAVENYPDLKASDNFMNLQRTLNEVESQIAAARRAYNAAATRFNNAIETFPGSLFAGSMKVARQPVFEIAPEERGNLDVKALFNS